MGSSISYFSLLQLNSLPSIAPYCNRYISAQKCILITASQKEEKYLDRVRVGAFYCATERESICRVEEQNYLFILHFLCKRIFNLLLCCANDGISPRFPIALPILYVISRAISVGTKPIARNMPTSPGFIT
jgi:hypothetical protein